MNATDIVTTVF